MVGKRDPSEKRIVEFFRQNGVPAIHVETFDVLAKILGDCYAIEVKRNDVKVKGREWDFGIHKQTWLNQIMTAEQFGWKRILIFCCKYGDYIIDDLGWIDQKVRKSPTKHTMRLSLQKRILLKYKCPTLAEWLKMLKILS